MTLGQPLINLACEQNFYPREQDFARKHMGGGGGKPFHFFLPPVFARQEHRFCSLTKSGYNQIYVVSALAQNICFFSL